MFWLLFAFHFSQRVLVFSIFSVLIIILGSVDLIFYLFLSICCWISNIYSSENQPFLIIILFLLTSFWLVLNLPYSSQISIILFLHLLCVRLLLKYLWSINLWSSLVYFRHWYLWFGWLLSSSFVYLKKNGQYSKDSDEAPMLPMKGTLADHDT